MVLKGEPDPRGPPASQPPRAEAHRRPVSPALRQTVLGLPPLPSTFSVSSKLQAHFFCTTGGRWDPAEQEGSLQGVVT